jgi:hypothetical protein
LVVELLGAGQEALVVERLGQEAPVVAWWSKCSAPALH